MDRQTRSTTRLVRWTCFGSNGTGWIVYSIGRALRRTHTGSVNVSVVSFVMGALAALAFLAYFFRDTWQLPFLH